MGGYGRRRKKIDDNNPLFGQINGDPICGIDLHVTSTKKRRKKRYGIENQYLLQSECKFFCKKTTHVFPDCADTDVVKNEMWV